MTMTKPRSNQVTFQPAGSGAVLTDVQTKLQEFVSVSDFLTLAQAITYAVTNNKVVRIDEDTTVNIPTDCPTLQNAVDHISAGNQLVTVTLRIESGHSPASGISVANGDFGFFTVTAADPTVTVSGSFPNTDGFIFGENARLPKLGALVNMNNRGYVGYYARLNSVGFVLPNCGIFNLGSAGAFGTTAPGLFVNANSVLYASGAKSYNNPRNVWATRGSQFEGEQGDFSGATGDIAIYASRNSTLHIVQCDVTGAANAGLVLRRSRATADASDFSNAGATGITLERTSQCSMTDRDAIVPKINLCGNDGVLVQQGSTFHFAGGQIQSNGRDGVSAALSSLVNVSSSSVTGNGRYGCTTRLNSNASVVDSTVTGSVTANIFITEGGFLTASNTTTDEGLVTKSYLGGRYNETLIVHPGFATNYGRFIVQSASSNPGGMEYDVTGMEIRWITNGTRRLRLLNTGTLRPEADNAYQLGTFDRRFSRVYSTAFYPGDSGGGSLFWTSGAGSPEGVVTAVVGSLYTRTDGGAATTLYVKETGSGTTGWVAK
jgi:hypothetical protein